MSGPFPHEHFADGPSLTRQQLFAFDRLNQLRDITRDAEATLLPLAHADHPKIVQRLNQIHRLLDASNKFLEWEDFDHIETVTRQIEGALRELRGLGKELGLHFMENIIP